MNRISKIFARFAAATATLLLSANLVHAAPLEHTIEFKKGKVIEVNYASLKPGAEAIIQKYRMKAYPVAQRYGVKSLGIFPIYKSDSKGSGLSQQPQFAAVFEWDNIESYIRMQEDQEYKAATIIRDPAMEYLNVGHFYTVDEDQSFTVTEGKFYELFSSDTAKNNEPAIMKLENFEKQKGLSKQVVLNRIHLSESTQNVILQSCKIGSDHHYMPNKLLINEWSKIERIGESSPLRNNAFDSYQSIVGPYNFDAFK